MSLILYITQLSKRKIMFNEYPEGTLTCDRRNNLNVYYQLFQSTKNDTIFVTNILHFTGKKAILFELFLYD